MITLLKNGISLGLSKLLIDKYYKYININVLDNSFTCNSPKELIDLMIYNDENKITVYELENYFQINS